MANVYVTYRIQAPVADVWAVIRDFNSLPQWHPRVTSSQIEDGLPGSSVGCIRRFQLHDGGATIREQLLALSDVDHAYTYSIVEAPIPVRNYRATLKLIEVTQDHTTLGEWQAEFEVAPEEHEQTAALVSGIFRDGFEQLNAQLAR